MSDPITDTDRMEVLEKNMWRIRVNDSYAHLGKTLFFVPLRNGDEWRAWSLREAADVFIRDERNFAAATPALEQIRNQPKPSLDTSTLK